MENTKLDPITATFTTWNGEWMIKTNRKITSDDRVSEMRTVMSGESEERMVAYVNVTTKSGAMKKVEVAEYEAETASGHIYSFRNI